nr:flagellar hook-length control protein FliK [Dyella terrae]
MPTAAHRGRSASLSTCRRSGPIQGELQLRALRLSVRLWAERADTVQRLEQQFGTLRQTLSSSGLTLDQLTCQQGMPQLSGQHSAILLRTTA